MQIQKIVCPIDFSECSDQALQYAAFAASLFQAELHMFHGLILHEDDPHAPEHHFPEFQELEGKMKRAVAGATDERLGDLEFKPSTVLCAQRRGFDAVEVILEYLQEVNADLVVMGTHGRKGPVRLLLGSVADKVVRWAHCSVLTVPPRSQRGEANTVEDILVPVDFSRLSRRTAGTAGELAQIFQAGLALLHVVEVASCPTLYDASFLDNRDQMKRQSLEALERLAHDLDLKNVRFEVRFGRPAHEILASSQANKCDLIVMGNHGLGGFRVFGLGTTAEHVVRSGKCPVLTFRSNDDLTDEREG